jgi:hypothetical protein
MLISKKKERDANNLQKYAEKKITYAVLEIF